MGELATTKGHGKIGEILVNKASKLVEDLAENKLTVAAAESCTGGLIASEIISIPGASEVLNESFITYSNEAKSTLIGVDPCAIEKYGVVSAEVAREMSRMAAIRANADLGISSTGIAGPDGGTEKTPVGTVFISASLKTDDGFRTEVKELHLTGDRNEVRAKAADEAIDLATACIPK